MSITISKVFFFFIFVNDVKLLTNAVKMFPITEDTESAILIDGSESDHSADHDIDTVTLKPQRNMSKIRKGIFMTTSIMTLTALLYNHLYQSDRNPTLKNPKNLQSIAKWIDHWKDHEYLQKCSNNLTKIQSDGEDLENSSTKDIYDLETDYFLQSNPSCDYADCRNDYDPEDHMGLWTPVCRNGACHRRIAEEDLCCEKGEGESPGKNFGNMDNSWCVHSNIENGKGIKKCGYREAVCKPPFPIPVNHEKHQLCLDDKDCDFCSNTAFCYAQTCVHRMKNQSEHCEGKADGEIVFDIEEEGLYDSEGTSDSDSKKKAHTDDVVWCMWGNTKDSLCQRKDLNQVEEVGEKDDGKKGEEVDGKQVEEDDEKQVEEVDGKQGEKDNGKQGENNDGKQVEEVDVLKEELSHVEHRNKVLTDVIEKLLDTKSKESDQV